MNLVNKRHESLGFAVIGVISAVVAHVGFDDWGTATGLFVGWVTFAWWVAYRALQEAAKQVIPEEHRASLNRVCKLYIRAIQIELEAKGQNFTPHELAATKETREAMMDLWERTK